MSAYRSQENGLQSQTFTRKSCVATSATSFEGSSIAVLEAGRKMGQKQAQRKSRDWNAI